MSNNPLHTLEKIHTGSTKRQPKYTAEQVARRRKTVALAAGLGIAAASLVGISKIEHTAPETVNAEITFGDHGSYDGVAGSIDRQFEGDNLDARDLTRDMKAAREADLLEKGKQPSPTDLSIVHEGETITIQIPRTDETDAAMQASEPFELGQLGSVQFSPVTPPAHQ